MSLTCDLGVYLIVRATLGVNLYGDGQGDGYDVCGLPAGCVTVRGAGDLAVGHVTAG